MADSIILRILKLLEGIPVPVQNKGHGDTRAGALMLDDPGETKAAARTVKGIERVIKEERIETCDLGAREKRSRWEMPLPTRP